jgi:hypothetical protein
MIFTQVKKIENIRMSEKKDPLGRHGIDGDKYDRDESIGRESC